MNTKHHHPSPLQSKWFQRHRGTAMMIVVALAFLVLNVFTPLYHDDFVYKFMFEGSTVNYDHPIQSVGDIFLSQVEHYHSVNGRSIVHFLVQLFTGLLDKQVFNIFNVIVFCIFICLLHRHFGKRSGWQGLGATVLILALVLLLPRFKDTFLWMTGSINYLWSATATLLFLLMYEKQRQRVTDKTLIPSLVAALLLGWTHEGITLPLAASLVIINLLSLKNNRGKQGLWLALAFLIGACITALAPGTIGRSGMTGGLSASALGLKVIAGMTVMGKLRLIWLALLLTAVLWFTDRDAVKRVLAHDDHLPLSALLSLVIIFASGQTLTRVAFGLELFSLIFLLHLIGEWWSRQSKTLQRWCTVGLTAALVAFYALLLYHTIPSWQESQRLLTQIEQTDASGGIIGTREHDAGCLNDFICTMLTRDATPNAMNYDPHSWPASIAAACHRDSLVFLPQIFLDDLKEHPDRYSSLDLHTPMEFYIKRIDEDAVIDSVTFRLAPNDFSDIPALFRPIARRMNRYTDTSVPTSKWVTLTLYGHRYLLIKRDHDLTPRLTTIDIASHPSTTI